MPENPTFPTLQENLAWRVGWISGASGPGNPPLPGAGPAPPPDTPWRLPYLHGFAAGRESWRIKMERRALEEEIDAEIEAEEIARDRARMAAAVAAEAEAAARRGRAAAAHRAQHQQQHQQQRHSTDVVWRDRNGKAYEIVDDHNRPHAPVRGRSQSRGRSRGPARPEIVYDDIVDDDDDDDRGRPLRMVPVGRESSRRRGDEVERVVDIDYYPRRGSFERKRTSTSIYLG